MSGWTPSPDDSSGSPAEPAAGGEDGTFGTQPGYETQPGGQTQPGFGTQPGYGTGYGPPPGYGTPGYAQPGPDGSYPAPPARSRARTWAGIIAGIVVLGVVIAGVSAYILNGSKKWTLTVPSSIAGLNRDTNPLDEQTFSSSVEAFKANMTSLHGYGQLDSTVSAIYTLGSSQAIGFAGFTGKFNAKIVLTPGRGGQVSNVSAGPHGGAAECARTGPETICQWSTGTTIGRIYIIPTTGNSTESISDADTLMIKIRDAVEKPAHGS
jgi:hypothetical protein